MKIACGDKFGEKQDVPALHLGLTSSCSQPQEEEESDDLARKPSAFNFSANGTVYAACPRCGANYSNVTPLILSCQHTFCDECLKVGPSE